MPKKMTKILTIHSDYWLDEGGKQEGRDCITPVFSSLFNGFIVVQAMTVSTEVHFPRLAVNE